MSFSEGRTLGWSRELSGGNLGPLDGQQRTKFWKGSGPCTEPGPTISDNILHFLNRTRRNYSRIPTDQLLSPPEHCAWLRRGHASGGSILYL